MDQRAYEREQEHEQERQHAAAAGRVAERIQERRAHEQVLAAPGGLARADTSERIGLRADRLGRFSPDGDLLGPAADRPGTGLEKIIKTVDYVGVRYLDAGVAAARAVGRVGIRDGRGNLVGFGTGSMVSPDLLLTNHHVLPDAGVARTSLIEFNYQDGVDGRPLPATACPLDPDRFFLADEALDVALVAVRAPAGAPAAFGFNPLIEAEGKAIIGEFVTIVQHPGGGRKQVALRENRIVDVLDQYLHYAADTEPGSSGSPVFNDQWEIVALHHASVPAPEHADLGGVINEGVRISRICRLVREAALPAPQRALADLAFAPETAALAAPAPVGPPAAATPAAVPPQAGGARAGTPVLQSASAVPATPPSSSAAGTATPRATATPLATAEVHTAARHGEVAVSIPLEITVRLGTGGGDGAAGGEPKTAEAITIDPDYGSRKGYDPRFLSAEVPMPVPSPAMASAVSGELRYHHFSVVMHRHRRLALFTACNINGVLARPPRREADRWIFDPRLAIGEQTGEDVYRDNPLDRGHLVRRVDPAWGTTDGEAKAANDDTFHFTNSTPQHHAFNAGQTLWAGLEDYILHNADNLDLLVNVFTGPVLAPDDEAYRGVLLPRQFWKVVSMVTGTGRLSATAYLLSQSSLIADLPTVESFSYGAYRTYQVPVRRIADLTGLGLDACVQADPLERLETTPAPREVVRPEDLVL
ncbi:endonuclease [Actinomadura sp. LD22]|uniref:Endonuclease n=1 Tax=Actinomadura physcomitrii TaxID=2650748 RepID=A0A6I4MMI5_9ACTN|nr:DNA/RNA non-specific endonuclease [Actinomadura physcomitrii]MWA05324.1 endonuclease [Actinomadura physcomitrii]